MLEDTVVSSIDMRPRPLSRCSLWDIASRGPRSPDSTDRGVRLRGAGRFDDGVLGIATETEE